MMQQYTDKNLTCVDCGQTFLFSADDQEFYARKGFTNEPKRCKVCRDKRKSSSGEGRERTGKDGIAVARGSCVGACRRASGDSGPWERDRLRCRVLGRIRRQG